MNKHDEDDHCSWAHQLADELFVHNPSNAEIEARATYLNYTCRQRHGGGNADIILPYISLAIQDSSDLTVSCQLPLIISACNVTHFLF